jgi:hypothetical protein
VLSITIKNNPMSTKPLGLYCMVLSIDVVCLLVIDVLKLNNIETPWFNFKEPIVRTTW